MVRQRDPVVQELASFPEGDRKRVVADAYPASVRHTMMMAIALAAIAVTTLLT